MSIKALHDNGIGSLANQISNSKPILDERRKFELFFSKLENHDILGSAWIIFERLLHFIIIIWLC